VWQRQRAWCVRAIAPRSCPHVASHRAECPPSTSTRTPRKALPDDHVGRSAEPCCACGAHDSALLDSQRVCVRFQSLCVCFACSLRVTGEDGGRQLGSLLSRVALGRNGRTLMMPPAATGVSNRARRLNPDGVCVRARACLPVSTGIASGAAAGWGRAAPCTMCTWTWPCTTTHLSQPCSLPRGVSRRVRAASSSLRAAS
jgi:hypothetical protein